MFKGLFFKHFFVFCISIIFFISSSNIIFPKSRSNNVQNQTSLSKIPASAIEITLKKTSDKTIIGKEITDNKGECTFNKLSNAEYNIFISNYNSAVIDSILKENSLTRKDVKLYSFFVRISVNGNGSQIEVIDKTNAQLNDKSQPKPFVQSVNSKTGNGNIGVSIYLEMEIKKKK
jgi:hypothetical protein